LVVRKRKATTDELKSHLDKLPLSDQADKDALASIADAAAGTGLAKFQTAADPACVNAFGEISVAAGKAAVICLVSAAETGVRGGAGRGARRERRKNVELV